MSKGNSPAFPCVDKDKRMWTGMNLRDYFALEALNSLIRITPADKVTEAWLANVAFKIADAMLDEREKYR